MLCNAGNNNSVESDGAYESDFIDDSDVGSETESEEEEEEDDTEDESDAGSGYYSDDSDSD
jgi:hypothetical protein